MIIGEMWLYGFISLILCLLWYFIKCNFETILKKLDIISQQRTDCRESLPIRFADKVETKDALEKIAGLLCDHNHRIINIENKINNSENRDVRN